ncbi:phosphotransferase [Flavobacteriaceae bacterium]|nr:phosphotransferase [Flavobacteriaceae bacterium]
MDLFKPDIFSQSTPNWIKATPCLEKELAPIISQIVPSSSLNELVIEFSGSMEINSSNFRLSFLNKRHILKKWPSTQAYACLVNIVKTNLFLIDNKIPVPDVIPFKNGQTILEWNTNLWTCSEFIDGEYFSGRNNQLKEASFITAKTANALYSLPEEIHPTRKINHKIDKILALVKKTDLLNVNWEQIFGHDISLLLEKNWSKIKRTCIDLKQVEIDGGPVFPNHYDMHPHNLLFIENKPLFLLDFDSIVGIPIGYSIAYSALKQCRQSIAYNQDFNALSQIGKNYIDSLHENLDIGDMKWINNFKALAQMETLRRIGIVLELNLDGNNAWNKVLYILISNLYEVEELFD